VHHGDSSRNVTANEGVEAGVDAAVNADVGRRDRITADDALRLAITLAVEAADYDRAAALLEIARRARTHS
jgi:hypothetical protein